VPAVALCSLSSTGMVGAMQHRYKASTNAITTMMFAALLAASACGTSTDGSSPGDVGALDAAAPAEDGAVAATDAASMGEDAAAATDGAPAADAGLFTRDGAATQSAEIYGVTIDAVDRLSDLTAALSALPKKPTARIVFDQGQAPSAYAQAVPAIHAVAHVMGELLDSESVKSTTVAQYTQRARDYLAAFPADVDVWEVGNEINGNWLGAAADVAAKMAGAYDVVKAAGARTELTLYGCSDAGASFDMITWTKANVPARMLTGLDLVLVSYYEGDCGSPRTDWAAAFQQLRQLYPNAALGFGEVGAVNAQGNSITDPALAGPYLQKYYGMKIATPGYVGGYFWWYFAEDMVPKTKPMFPVLSAAIGAMP
jgi:hypothetical protein